MNWTMKYLKTTRKGWCPRTGKGERFMDKEAVNGNISGQHSLMSLALSFLIHLIILRAYFIKPAEHKILCLVLGQVHTEHLVLGFWIFEKSHSGPELWPFENGLTKSVRKAPILGPIWQLPSLNVHNLNPRGPIDLNFFSYGKTTSRAWWWPQKLSQKSISSQSYKSIQSIPTKWYSWAFFFTKRHHYFGFHCFCFHCQDSGRFL